MKLRSSGVGLSSEHWQCCNLPSCQPLYTSNWHFWQMVQMSAQCLLSKTEKAQISGQMQIICTGSQHCLAQISGSKWVGICNDTSSVTNALNYISDCDQVLRGSAQLAWGNWWDWRPLKIRLWRCSVMGALSRFDSYKCTRYLLLDRFKSFAI